MSLDLCVVNDCQQQAAHPAVFCAGHLSGAGGTPGRVEPAVEERARRAGEAEIQRALAERPVILPAQGDPWRPPPTTNGHDPASYLASCLAGEQGQMRQMVARALLPALEQALRNL